MDKHVLKGDSRQRLALLSEIARSVNSSLDLDEVLNLAIDKVLEITGAERGFLMLRDTGSDELVFRVARNIERETIQAPEFQVSRGILAQVAQEGRPLLTSNAQKDQRLMGRGSVQELGLRSVLCVPLQARDRSIGLIYVDNPYQEGIFSEEDLELISSLAHQAAVAIENARLYQEVARSAEEMAQLYDTSLDIVQELDLPKVLEAILDRAAKLLKARSANLRIYDPKQDELIPLVPYKQPEKIARVHLKPGEGVSGQAFASGEPVVVDDYDTWEGRSAQYAKGVFARSMAVPLKRGAQAIGVLAVDRNREDLPFNQDDVRLLSLFANQAAVAIDNARLYETARETSEQLSQLYETSLDITRQLDLPRVLERIIQRAVGLVQGRFGQIYLYDEVRQELRSSVTYNLPDSIWGFVLKPGEGLTGKILLSRKPLIVTDYDAWMGRFPKVPPGIVYHAAGVPVEHGDHVLGIFWVGRSREDPPFTEQDIQLMTLFANQAAVAIANAQLYEESQQRGKELARLYETSLDVTSQLDLSQVLRAIVRRTAEIVQAREGEVVVYDPQERVIRAFLSMGLAEAGIPSTIHEVGKPPEGLDGLVITTGKPVRVEDYDSWPQRIEGAPKGAIGPAIGVPIIHQNQILGCLSLTRVLGEPAFTDQDERRLTLFANQAAVAIANAQQYQELQRLYLETKEKERMEQELRMAYAIQTSLLPEGCPVVPGWEVAAHWHPAREISGDFYDFIPLDNGKIGILIGDVSDKGVPAALFMALARSLLWAAVSEGLAPAQVMAKANQQILANARSGMFVTALCGFLDPATHSMTCSNAGHPPPIVLRAESLHAESLQIEGMALGVVGQVDFQESSFAFGPGDCVLLYTDGITEAQDPQGREFGQERLVAFLRENQASSAEQLVHGLIAAVQDFVGEAAQYDDFTLIALQCRGRRP
ncbi:MAG: GAF domain-containing protein [Chloroflexi bacterium]|nr:GAF domain-containing protein [Chloroflexota bacterium]